jgi:hypothetical protein
MAYPAVRGPAVLLEGIFEGIGVGFEGIGVSATAPQDNYFLAAQAALLSSPTCCSV